MAYTTIDKPTDYFRVKTYSGNSSTQSITWDESDNMKADWLWLKGRGYADGHALVDVIRGSTKNISSDSTTAEFTQTNGVTSLDTNGWSMGNWSAINRSSSGTAVGWGWLAGGTASSNSDGSITSSVSANTTAGFSVVTYTGSGSNPATIGHGLGAVPQVMLLKKRTGSSALEWKVYHEEIGNAKYLILDKTNAQASDTTIWNSTTPSSSVFTVGSSDTNNTDDFVVYCFAEKKGFSRFGSYVGNGSSDGSYIHLGFKPAFFLLKSSSSGTSSFDWVLLDNKRPGYNVVNKLLYPNGNFAEGTSDIGDFTSNGFKIRSSNQTFNKSGDTFIYMAFAESPFVTSTGIPTTAR